MRRECRGTVTRDSSSYTSLRRLYSVKYKSLGQARLHLYGSQFAFTNHLHQTIYTYTFGQKFYSIEISVLLVKIKIWKKNKHIGNNGKEIYVIQQSCRKVIKNWWKKKKFPMNNQISYPFFNFKWIYWFFKIHINFFNFFYVLEFFNYKNQGNVGNFW